MTHISETTNRLEWHEDENCIRVVDSNRDDIHVFWNQDLDSLRINPNFASNVTVVGYILDNIDPCDGEFLGGIYSTYDMELKDVLNIIQTRDISLAAMARKRESSILSKIEDLFTENKLAYCFHEFNQIAESFIEIESTNSILIEYLKIVTYKYSTDERLEIDFYINEMDSIESEIFCSGKSEDEQDD